jgi:hypothetical protein
MGGGFAELRHSCGTADGEATTVRRRRRIWTALSSFCVTSVAGMR